MKRNVITTLITKDYIDQAKQLFSSIYWNAGWDGDYVLLTYEIPERHLKWFKKKGIFIRKCKKLYKTSVLKRMGIKRPEWVKILLTKLNLFDLYFKQWDKLIYIDSDMIVRASLKELTKIETFAAVEDVTCFSGHFEFNNKNNYYLYNELSKKIDMNSKCFNAGLLVINTDIINKNLIVKFKKLFSKYREIGKKGDQWVFNLLFYKKWEKIPSAYNTIITSSMVRKTGIKMIEAIAIHTVSIIKMWDKRSPFYKEWCRNLRKANLININNPQPAKNKWTNREIKLHKLYFQLYYQNVFHNMIMDSIKKAYEILKTPYPQFENAKVYLENILNFCKDCQIK